MTTWSSGGRSSKEAPSLSMTRARGPFAPLEVRWESFGRNAASSDLRGWRLHSSLHRGYNSTARFCQPRTAGRTLQRSHLEWRGNTLDRARNLRSRSARARSPSRRPGRRLADRVAEVAGGVADLKTAVGDLKSGRRPRWATSATRVGDRRADVGQARRPRSPTRDFVYLSGV